jgi:thiamine biosynthesis lipoprotein
MATRFEVLLCGEDLTRLRAAGEEALDEIERLENQLSLFRPASEIAHLNARAALEPIRVSPALFSLLKQARALSEVTGGAFDITVAPLVRCWGFMEGSGRVPNPDQLAQACALVGTHLVQLNEPDLTVQFSKTGVMIDLGAIGKGYAIDRAAEILREVGVTSALLHGGTSSIYAVGSPPNADHWLVGIENPCARGQPLAGEPGSARSTAPLIASVPLKDESLSVSANSEKFFEAGGKTFGHVLDPRTGEPSSKALLAAVILPLATETDALSTALLTLGASGSSLLSSIRPTVRTLVIDRYNDELYYHTNGIALSSADGS